MRFVGDIDDLVSDLERNAVTFNARAAGDVRDAALGGTRDAKRLATRSAGKHGKHYPNAITAEPLTALAWEYGPDSALPQGGMSFEFGSRNQPPHLDLAQSADGLPSSLVRKLDRTLDRMFW